MYSHLSEGKKDNVNDHVDSTSEDTLIQLDSQPTGK